MVLPKPITTEADVHAWRALLNGRATSEQQVRCANWLAAATGRMGVPYVSGPDGERDTLVLLGGQRIGVMVGNMMLEATLAEAREDDRRRASPQLHTEETPRARPSRRSTPKRQ